MGLLAASAVIALPRDADAHIMPPGQGNTRVVGNRCYTLVSVPVAVLTGFDDDHNGLLSPEELGRHLKEIEAQLEQKVRLFDDTVLGKTLYQQVLVEHTDSVVTNMTSVTLMRVTEFPRPVKKLRVMLDLFPAGSTDSLAFSAIRDSRTDTQHFSAASHEHVFFRGEGLGSWIFAALAIAALGLLVSLRDARGS